MVAGKERAMSPALPDDVMDSNWFLQSHITKEASRALLAISSPGDARHLFDDMLREELFGHWVLAEGGGGGVEVELYLLLLKSVAAVVKFGAELLKAAELCSLLTSGLSELGCGHGLPAIFACLQGATAVHFQDFNAEVLQCLAIPNVNANLASSKHSGSKVADKAIPNVNANLASSKHSGIFTNLSRSAFVVPLEWLTGLMAAKKDYFDTWLKTSWLRKSVKERQCIPVIFITLNPLGTNNSTSVHTLLAFIMTTYNLLR
ncbi:hypothetical protein MLD38_017723 [Melastoma candidum]|uniref:Uncharacterized protein n=1 Tax=Melastoma candidum TaxID=119954 RepID=A0ACB9QSP7_9MYRT|nr:hypothetical protein MLD38_017723 [Melastoma candidum]